MADADTVITDPPVTERADGQPLLEYPLSLFVSPATTLRDHPASNGNALDDSISAFDCLRRLVFFL